MAAMKIPLLRHVVPPHVFCLLGDGVTYANVRRDPPRGFAQSRYFAYPPGSLGAGSAGTPLFSREAIAEAVESGRRLSPERLTRASVVFPDAWARMLPVDFDTLPDSPPAAREMVGWKVKKLLPGITSDLTIAFREMTATGEGKRLLVAAAPTDTLQSIEKSFESLGVRVGVLAPSSLVLFDGLAPVLAARASGDYALIHRASDSFVFVVAHNGAPIFFRQRPAEEEEQEDHDQEIRLSLSYYMEKLAGAGLSAVFLYDETPRDGSLSASFPVAPQPLTGSLFGADTIFDERVAARPELMAAFAAVYGRG
jgi:hypothetical protein